MISFLTYALIRAFFSVHLVVAGALGPSVVVSSSGVGVDRPAVVHSESSCQTALSYLHAHGNPAFQMRCDPGSLPDGIAAVTCWRAASLGVSCPDGGVVVISTPTCPISYENEASNSWLDFSTLTSGAINGRDRHDASGRVVDPFGECG